jgi:hypothetical protein
MVLHPADALAAPSPERVTALLAALGLLAGPLASGKWGTPGPRFMELVTFLGCSPALMTEGESAYGVRVAPVAQRPRLRLGANTAAPRCPRCRRSVDGWPAQLPAWRSGPLEAQWVCPGCGAAASASDLDWRRGAGIARIFADLCGVYPAEAVPGDELLDALRGLDGGRWSYFFLRDEIS